MVALTMRQVQVLVWSTVGVYLHYLQLIPIQIHISTIHYPSDFVATKAGNRKKFEMLTFPFAFCGLFCTNCIPFVQGKETLSFVNPPQRASVDFRSPALFRCHFWCHTVFAIIWQLMCDATASFTFRYRGTLTHGRRYGHRGCLYMCPYKY